MMSEGPHNGGEEQHGRGAVFGAYAYEAWEASLGMGRGRWFEEGKGLWNGMKRHILVE
jgi:hypothetical protein